MVTYIHNKSNHFFYSLNQQHHTYRKDLKNQLLQSHHTLTKVYLVSIIQKVTYKSLTVSILGNKGNKGATNNANGKTTGGAPLVSKDELRTIREKTEKGQKADAVIIPKSELDRIKGSTKI